HRANAPKQAPNGLARIKKFDRQDRGQAAENIEVIPLDDVSHRRGDDPAPEILRDFNSHIVLLRIARLYRVAVRGCTGRPAAKCFLTLRNCSRPDVDRVATAVPGPRPREGPNR